jgi:hypothetical protein
MAGIDADMMQKDPFPWPREWRLRPVLDFNPGVSDDRALDLREKDGMVSLSHCGHEKVTNLACVCYRLKVGRIHLGVQLMIETPAANEFRKLCRNV